MMISLTQLFTVSIRLNVDTHMMKSLRLLLLLVPFLPACSSFAFPLLFPAPSAKNTESRLVDKRQFNSPSVSKPSCVSVVAAALTAWTMIATSVLTPLPCAAAESRLIGQIAGSGLVFKDTLNVESFDDPKVMYPLVFHVHTIR